MADLGRFAELGVTASVQPSHATADRDQADRIWGARAAAAYRWRDLLDAGAHLAFGSDAPVAELDPLAGIQAAVHRTSDAREPWYPGQGLDVADAVLGFTAGAANAAGDHRRRACSCPGTAPTWPCSTPTSSPTPIASTGAQVVATMLAGRWVYGAPPW